MNYINSRLRERSTYQGLAVLLGLFGITLTPEMTEAIIGLSVAVCAALHALFPQSGVVAPSPEIQSKISQPLGVLLAFALLAGSLSACAIPIASVAAIAGSMVVSAAGTYAAVEQGKLAARTNNLDGVAAGLNAYCASYGGTAAAINREALKTSLVAAGIDDESAKSVTASLADMRQAICSANQASP